MNWRPKEFVQTGPEISNEEFGLAYQQSFAITVRFLVSKGLSRDTATETSQDAWVRGWERRSQIRDASCLLSWINTIALNIFRCNLRREPQFQALPVIPVAPRASLAALDVTRILKACKPEERTLFAAAPSGRAKHLRHRPGTSLHGNGYACEADARSPRGDGQGRSYALAGSRLPAGCLTIVLDIPGRASRERAS